MAVEDTTTITATEEMMRTETMNVDEREAEEVTDSEEMMMVGEETDSEEVMMMMAEEKIGPEEVASPEEEMTSAERTSFEEVVKQGAAMTVNLSLGGLGSGMEVAGLILLLTLFPMDQIL